MRNIKIWRNITIDDIAPIYKISNFGEVKNKKTGKILKQRKSYIV